MIEINDNKKDIEDWTPEPFKIPDHWLNVNFDDLFDILSINGLKIPQSDYLLQGEFPIIDQGAEQIGGYTNTASCVLKNDGGLIVFGDHTRCLKLINFDFAPGADGIKVLKPRRGLNINYLFYACTAMKLPNRGYSRHFAFLKKSQIPLPPFNEQVRIVAKIEELFSELDNGNKSLKTAREQLKVYRQAILKHAFEGKLTAAWREKNKDNLETSEQLLERIKKERRATWEADLRAKGKDPAKVKYVEPAKPDVEGLPKLPEGWSWATVEQIATLVTDGDHNPPKRTSSGIPHLTAKNIINSGIDISGCTFIKEEDAERVFKRYKPLFGDLIVTCVGTLGRTAIVPDGIIFSPDRNLAAIRPVLGYRFSKYLEYCLQSPHFQNILANASGSTAQPHLYLTDLRGLVFPLPSLAEQEQIVSEIEQRLSILTQLEIMVVANLKRVERLHQSILKEAFAGQLVSQDQNDEPASVLLERIRSEKTTSQATTKNAHYHEVKPVNEYAQSFLIPETAV
jgi:type I restriction enzyme S subunit